MDNRKFWKGVEAWQKLQKQMHLMTNSQKGTMYWEGRFAWRQAEKYIQAQEDRAANRKPQPPRKEL